MLRIRNLSNAMQKRTLRVLHGQTQATPYAGTLDASLRNTDGSFRRPLAADTVPVARSADAFVLQGGLVPGMVMTKAAGEGFVVATGANTVARNFGLLANFVGGTLDDLQDANEIGVWYGPGSVYEVLFPAFDDTGLAALYAAATPGAPVYMAAGTDGRLKGFADAAALGSRVAVAELIERRSAGVIQIKLLV